MSVCVCPIWLLYIVDDDSRVIRKLVIGSMVEVGGAIKRMEGSAGR